MSKKVLMIMHATSWSDKLSKAKEEIQRMIDQEDYYKIIEFIISREDIYSPRYIQHQGEVYKHSEISPVPFLMDNLSIIIDKLSLNNKDIIEIVGGVYNDSEGCLNILEMHLKEVLNQLSLKTEVKVILKATY